MGWPQCLIIILNSGGNRSHQLRIKENFYSSGQKETTWKVTRSSQPFHKCSKKQTNQKPKKKKKKKRQEHILKVWVKNFQELLAFLAGCGDSHL